MHKTLMLTLTLFSSILMAEDIFKLKFDDLTGLLINPDKQYLSKGLDDEKSGRIESAMTNYIKSAQYGNYLAISLVGFIHLKEKRYIESLAWLKLIEIDKLENKENVVEMITKLEAYLRPDEMLEVNAKYTELKTTYGALPTLLKRKHWKNNIKVSSSRTNTGIPTSVTFGLNSGVVVDAGSVKKQIDEFVYSDEFSSVDAFVILNELGEINE